MNSDHLEILYFRPGEPPKDLAIDGDLGTMQRLVGGLIETMYIPELGPEIVLIGNDEARLIGMPWNRTTDHYPIAGPFFALGGTQDGGSRSLGADERQRVLQYFAGRELKGKSFPPQGPAITLDAADATKTLYRDAAALAIQQHLALEEFEHLHALPGFERERAGRLIDEVDTFICRHQALPNHSDFMNLLVKVMAG
jgi:hypothetical protein